MRGKRGRGVGSNCCVVHRLTGPPKGSEGNNEEALSDLKLVTVGRFCEGYVNMLESKGHEGDQTDLFKHTHT